jgi:hypothetical protein
MCSINELLGTSTALPLTQLAEKKQERKKQEEKSYLLSLCPTSLPNWTADFDQMNKHCVLILTVIEKHQYLYELFQQLLLRIIVKCYCD